MDSVSVPLRSSGKKMRKRRELDALVAHSLAKRACNSGKRQAGNGINSQDQLLSQSTDDQEEYSLSKIQISKRHRKHFSFLRTCAPLLLIFSVFLLFSFMYWLYLDLREQLSDQRNKIEQVSAICLTMPETLQKLHENSKNLEQNQTAISQKIYDIQQRIETVEKEFLQLKDNIRKKEDGTDSDKTVDLKDTVAGFGAKIQALDSDVKTLKEDRTVIQQTQQNEKLRLDALRTAVDNVANSTQIASNTGVPNDSNNWMKNFTERYSNDLKNMSNQLIAINDTFSQKIKTMDNEMQDHQTKLDSLNESFANVSSHVSSIENGWPTLMEANQKHDKAITLMSSDIVNIKSSIRNIQATTLSQQMANKKITNSNINESVPIFQQQSQDPVNSLLKNTSASQVTSFPAELLDNNKVANATKIKQNTDITPEPPKKQNDSVTQPLTSSTSVPGSMAN